MKLKVIASNGKKTSSIKVNDQLLAEKTNDFLIAQAVRVYLSNKRQATSKTKNRTEVVRTKSKWYRQKGTGNARHGAKNANLFVGGAVAHGPDGSQHWTLKLSKKQKKQSLRCALKAQENNILISKDLKDLKGKTKKAAILLKSIADYENNKVLVIISTKANKLIHRSLRNIQNVLISNANHLNTLQVAAADKIIISDQALEDLEKRLVKNKAEVKKVEVKKTKKTVSKKTKTKTKKKKTKKTVKTEKKS